MERHAMPIRCEEARQYLDQLSDPIAKNFVNMAFTLVIKKCFLEKSDFPKGDFDMLFYVKTLADFFSEHDVIEKTLAGEKVGAWVDAPA